MHYQPVSIPVIIESMIFIGRQLHGFSAAVLIHWVYRRRCNGVAGPDEKRHGLY
ncbi:hypothetical protein D3C81_2157250 [compost metagenome]